MPSTKDPSKKELVQVADRFGNHLALVYNRNFIREPPKTTDELVDLAVKNTIDENGDGHKDRYGLVWNFTEPFFGIPFFTGYGGWVFAERGGRATSIQRRGRRLHLIRRKRWRRGVSCSRCK